ncbi:MAG TPA: dual specificity protein phosphatase family protein [Verrucomicrobiae bacterium]
MKRCLCFCLLFVFVIANGGERGLPAREGIGNFGKVNDEVYRGAQPDAAGIQSLKRLGIKTIVCLRTSAKDWRKEVAEARTHGILCTNIPLSGVRRPKAEQVRQVLAAIEALPAPVFVHCQHGCDRTGTIIACYRIRYENWSAVAALKEAELYGLSKLERGMRDFILDFGKPERPAKK